MKSNKFPHTNDISLTSLSHNCKIEYGMNIGDFERSIFNASGWLSRIKRKKAKMDNLHYQHLFDLLKEESGGTSESFALLMKSWYPSLSVYTTEEEIKTIIRANIDGTTDKLIKDSVLGAKQLLQSCIENNLPIKCVKIAAHTGWKWFEDRERTDLLTELAKSNISIQVIGNPSSPTMHKIAGAMSNSVDELRYMGFNNTLSKWHDYEQAFPSISLRVTTYPVLRQTLIVEFEDGTSKAFIRDYTYGSPVEHTSPHKQISSSNPDYKYYKNEFEFLWENAETYETWHNSLPEPEESIQSNNYILLYPSHARTDSSIRNVSNWIYSALSINSDNTASLKVNISNSFESIKHWEYSYTGSLKLTRNNIFISLVDNECQEKIHISLARPLHHKDRFLGIMTGLSPSGQPVAFKCACIGRSILPNLDYEILYELLCNHNKEWKDTLLVLENQDINLFYSDKILSERSR